jgi:hypothetical protein
MVSIMDVDEPAMMLIHQFAFEVLVVPIGDIHDRNNTPRTKGPHHQR